ncbi:MAG: hypothetical protein J5938_04415 [Clostridia bacterium]|nr:hypothetical protein [Clostridia bacterium]
MFRHCYRAQYRSEAVIETVKRFAPLWKELLKENRILSATAFRYGADNLFLYWECSHTGDLSVEDVFPGLTPFLVPWPGEAQPRYYIPMLELYHSYDPSPEEEPAWKRESHVEPEGMMSIMVPEMMASYIFLHHQLQEEAPGDNGKDLTIWFDGPLAILYTERPKRRVDQPRPGKLKTHNTPDNWGEVMDPYFVPFPDGNLYEYASVLLTMSHGDID